LNKYFLHFKQDLIKDKDWQTLYLNPKENLILRFHQELITTKTNKLIESGEKSFLWGCKCRSGKTYMVGGIILKQLSIKKTLNVLIITPAPTETIHQFTNDLFNKFRDFNDFKIRHIKGSKKLTSIEFGENNIIVLSKQLLQKYINDKTISKIKNLKLDIIAFDENHFTGTTDLSKDIISSYSSKNTVKIYLTATYNKPLHEFNILPDCQMFWDIEDEQICKSIVIDNKALTKGLLGTTLRSVRASVSAKHRKTNIVSTRHGLPQIGEGLALRARDEIARDSMSLIDNTNIVKLKEKHGDKYISETIKSYTDLGHSINDIFQCYNNMPEFHLITNLFDQERYETIKKKLDKNTENKMGFSFDALLGLNKQKTQFIYEKEVETFLRYISGSYKEEDGEKTLFPRMNNICAEKESRLPKTQIWFLPHNNINEISKCLELLMKEDLILKRYSILCINRNNKKLAKDVKDEITKAEIQAKSKGKLGLILLAGSMLTLGITLNLCDLVILMNNTISSDKILQQMYRCMTEGQNKKIGFVIDLNISRVLNTCINYTVYKNSTNIENKISYLIKNRLINIDEDMMDNKKINSDTIIKKLMEKWKEDPINSFKLLIRRLENDCIEFDSHTQQLINKTFTKTLKRDKISENVIMKDEDDELQELPTGVEKIKSETDNSSDYESSDDEEELQISFPKDVLPYIIPLTCILTIKNTERDFIKTLNLVKETPELLETFNEQCLIWWNKKDLIDLLFITK